MKKIFIVLINIFSKIFYNLFYIMTKFSKEKIMKEFTDNSAFYIFLAIIIFLGLYYYFNYMHNKHSGKYQKETYSQNNNTAYVNNYNPKNGSVQPSQPLGQNEVYSSVHHNQPLNLAQSCKQNPSDLLPKDSNNQWSTLNPSGKGDLSNINLLKAGYHIGIDTIGQTLRNANLQIRSEPPNPQLSVGPWNQSTITPDFLRPPLEIGCGTQ